MAKGKKQHQLKERALDYLQRSIQDQTTLLDNHKESLDAYMAKPLGNEVQGRSQIVMSDVADTVEWIMPVLMKIFYGGAQVVQVKPQGMDDEDKAPLMEEKLNFDFQRQNNGYAIFHDWFKTALLCKYSAVKYWWENKEEYKKEDYEGLSQAEYDTISQREDYIIDEEEATVLQEALIDALGSVLRPEIVAYNIKGRKIKKISRPVIIPLPPEEYIFDIKNPDDFQAHKKKVHKNYLKRYNLKPSDIEKEIQAYDTGEYIKEARFEDLGGINFVTDDLDGDFVYIYECYFNDYDDKGNEVPKKVVIYGNKVLEEEDNTYGKPPFCGLTTIKIPHRAAGRNVFDIVYDLQKLHTALMRAILDNIYYQNNGVTAINPYRINMDDVINRNEPGAKWRTLYDVDPRTVIAPVPTNPIAPQAFSLLETVQTIKEKRTGVTSYNQGLDSKSLNKTATGISQIMGAAQQRMELIARNFAETGVRDLFKALVDMNLNFFDSEVSVKLNDKWSQITPEMIDGQFDLVLDVGVGTGSQEVKIGQLINMINVSQPGMETGVVTPKNLYEILRSIYELMGYKNPDRFVSDPNSPENKQQQGPPPELMQQLQEMQQIIQDLEEKLKTAEDKKEIEMAKVALEEAKLRLQEKEMELKYSQQERFKAIEILSAEDEEGKGEKSGTKKDS